MIYLNSALIEELQQAVILGWVKGITTNPTLIAKSNLDPETCAKLAAISPGELYDQLMATNFDNMIAEEPKADKIIGEKTVFKVSATAIGFQLVATLFSEINCSVTAIYSASQAALAREAGVFN